MTSIFGLIWIINEFENLGKRGSAPDKQKLRVTCPTGKVEFKYFSSPALKTTMREKIRKIHFTDQKVSSYSIDLKVGFLNWPIKTDILKIWWWRVYNSCIFTSHNHVYILSCNHASRQIRACALSYFIITYDSAFK